MWSSKKHGLLFCILLCTVLLCGCAVSAPQEITAPSADAVETMTPQVQETVPESIPDDGTVYVSDVNAFLAAIAPDTVIVLEPGEYNLRTAKNYGRGGTQWYHWESVFDGSELVITDVSNLTIRGADTSLVTISAEPRYAEVLHFNAVSNVVLDSLTFGHTAEPGSCTGGVLYFENSREIDILNSRMYGCGVLGILLEKCQAVHVDYSDIYECSEGGVRIDRSRNVLFENCKVYDCQVYSGLFDINSSEQVAVINSELFRNSGWSFDYGSLVQSNCPGVYLGGLDVHDNNFAYMFDTQLHPVTVEKCRFQWSANQWTTGAMPRAADGTALSAGDLSQMQMRTAFWTPAEQLILPVAAPSQDGRIHVCTVDDFLGAIGHDTTIYLEPGVYDLSTASNYGGYGGDFYHWEETYDGPELVIHNVKGLTIEGAGPDQVTILAIPRFANVLRFEYTNGLVLRGVTAGHSLKPEACSGGVIQLNMCTNTNIEGCSLYGCGILGVWGMDCSYLYVTGTEIYECSSGAAWFYNCRTVSIDHCNIHDIAGMVFYADYESKDIRVDGELLQPY